MIFGFGKGKSHSASDDMNVDEFDDEVGALPEAHPRFAAHFTDPLYEDEGDEFAPFGSDEGSDTLAMWDDRRDELTQATTVRWMMDDEETPFSFDDALDEMNEPRDEGASVDGITFLISTAFTLLRFTGQIDEEGKQAALRALNIMRGEFDDPSFVTQINDLERWTN